MNVLSRSSVTQSLQFVLTSTLILLFISLGNAQYLSSNNCGSNQEVDVYMQGVLGQSSPSIYIGSVSTATKLFVNVWIEANDCSGSFPSSITITNGSQSFNVGQTSVTQSTGSNVLEKLYRATINNPTSTTVSVSGMGSCTSTSISVQKVRTGTGRASYIRAINKEFDETNSTYTMNIGSATIARNISILVPIHEKSNDGRVARVEVWGNGVALKYSQITSQNKGNEAGLITVNLSNVPASTTQLNVKIISPSGNGASFGVGVITSKTTSACTVACTPTTIVPYVQVNSGGWVNSSSISACAGNTFYIGTQTGLQSGMVLTYPNGFVDNTPNGNSYFTFSNASTSNSGTYTLTYTNSGGCVSTRNYTVNVSSGSVGGSANPSTQTICQGTNSVPTRHTVSGYTGTVVRWEYKSTTSGWTYWGAGSATAPSSCCFSTVGTWQVRAIVKNGNCSEVASSAASIIVTSPSVGGTVSSSSSSVCASTSNFPAGFFTLSGHAGTVERWEWSLNNSYWFNWNGGGSTSSLSGWVNNGATFYVRARVKNGSCSSVYSSVRSVTVIENYTSGGTISGTQSGCGSYNPPTITSSASPSGGSGGTTQYQWQYRNGTSGTWINISGATSSTYNPSTITQTRQYQRGARRSVCTAYVYSNIITKTVNTNYTSGGTISGTQSGCGSYNPPTITSSASPSGGSGGTTQYQWQYRNGTSGTWVGISGATSATYDPGTITQTRQYQRGSRRSVCTAYVYSNIITKTVNTNYTSGGAISGTQSSCGTYNPSNITSSVSPSGGSGGTTQYQWEYRNGTSGTWVTISGATSSTYDPSTITQTRQYRRNSRRSICTSWISSNVITKTVVSSITISNVSKVNPTCPSGSNNGSITVTASIASGTLEYRLNNGAYQSNNVFTNLGANTYTVQVRQVGGTCTESWGSSVVLATPNCSENCTDGVDNDGDGLIDCADSDCLPTISTVSKVNPTCVAGSSDGSISITANISGGTLEYRLNSGAYQNNNVFTSLGAGTYTVQVRQVGTSCTSTWSSSMVLSTQNCVENCTDGVDNDSDGLIDCADPDCVPTISNVSKVNPICPSGSNNGSITITGSISNGTLEYRLNSGAYQNNNIFSNLSAGTYTVQVRQIGTTCAATWSSSMVLNAPNCVEICNNGIDDDGDGLTDCADLDCLPTISNVSPTNLVCPIGTNNGSITVTATISSGTLEYRLNSGAYQNSNVFTNLAAGTYTVQVRQVGTTCTETWNETITLIASTSCTEICGNGIDDDGNGLIDCADSSCKPVISVSFTLPTCTNKTGGEITITATNSGNLSYSIKNEASWQTSNTFTNLGVGQYTIRVKNDGGCITEDTNNPVIFDFRTCIEVCTDGVDNDGDGQIDCDDPDCRGVGTGKINN